MEGMRIPLKKITIFMGLDQNQQMVAQTMVTTGDKKLYVVAGKLAIVEQTTPQGKTIREIPLNPFGWEYVIENGVT